MSETAVSGILDNPWAKSYSADGSSSGSASLIASCQVNMSLGHDQGGSIRMPASFCGIVGLSLMGGLVPYTGTPGLDASIDHAGPNSLGRKFDESMLLKVAGSYEKEWG